MNRIHLRLFFLPLAWLASSLSPLASAQNVNVQADSTTGVLWRPSAFITGNSLLTTTAAAAAYQPLDADLTSIAGNTTGGFLTRTAANTYTPRTLTGTAGQITVTNGDGVSGDPTISLPSTITQATTFSATANFSADAVVSGRVQIAKDLNVTGNSQPASLSANQNDYSPTSFADTVAIGITSSTPVSITGLDTSVLAQSTGTVRWIYNRGTNAITLVNQSTSSLTQNRFALASDVVLPGGAGVELVYFGSRWRMVGSAGTGVTSIAGTAGQITASASTGAVTLSLPSTITQATTFSGITTVSNATASTNSTTGALVVSGGLGVATNAFFGAGITAASGIGVGGNSGSGLNSSFGGTITTTSTSSQGIQQVASTTEVGLSLKNTGTGGLDYTTYSTGNGSGFGNGLWILRDATNGASRIIVSTTAAKFLNGLQSTGATEGVGYATGAGGAVTQITSRTTGVTLNKVTGAITLVSAAGSTSWQTFTVTNSAVAATDVVIVSQKSGTDLYEIHVTAVAAGSFNVSFKTTGGTTTEQPVFNFAVIKGVTS